MRMTTTLHALKQLAGPVEWKKICAALAYPYEHPIRPLRRGPLCYLSDSGVLIIGSPRKKYRRRLRLSNWGNLRSRQAKLLLYVYSNPKIITAAQSVSTEGYPNVPARWVKPKAAEYLGSPRYFRRVGR